MTSVSSVSEPNNNNGNASKSLKVVMVGDSGVGKSCLLARLTDPSPSPSFISTIGVEVRSHVVDGVRMQVWDTGGQQRYRAVLASCYRQADVVLLVFDVTNPKSFLNVRQWLREMNEALDGKGARLVLVANKCDCANRAVSRDEGEGLAKQNKMGYIETSARTGSNVRHAFFAALNEPKR